MLKNNLINKLKRIHKDGGKKIDIASFSPFAIFRTEDGMNAFRARDSGLVVFCLET